MRMTMPERLRLLLVDDHPLIRSAIRSALEAAPDMQVVDEAVEGYSVRQRSQEAQPDVIVLDLHMPGPPPFALIADLRAAARQPAGPQAGRERLGKRA